MKVQGFFSKCVEEPWASKDGTKSGKSTKGVFVIGQDQVKWESYHDASWCIEHGIQTGAAGEATLAFSISDYGYQRVTLLGFKPLAKKEPSIPEPQEKSPEMQAVAEQMVAAAQSDPSANTDLPF